ncbi:MAG: CarD family transcriptional regulator [Acuticoccus sp.]
MATVKKSVAKSAFKPNEHVVYPAHGVGQVQAIEKTEFGGHALELIVVTFAKDKMTLRVPVGKATSVGMRKLSDQRTMQRALEVVTGRARIKRTMWSRRAQEYEAKINSGDLIAIAEVVRDLYRAESQPEQSYSERQLYEAALDRMAREIAAINKSDEPAAIKIIEAQLAKAPRRPAKGAETEESDDDEDLQEKAA